MLLRTSLFKGHFSPPHMLKRALLHTPAIIMTVHTRR